MDNDSDQGYFSLLGLFRSEIKSQAALLKQALQKLPSGDSFADDQYLENLQKIFRYVKGGAKISQLPTLTSLCQTVDDALMAAREDKWKLNNNNGSVFHEICNMFQLIGNTADNNVKGMCKQPNFELLSYKITSLIPSTIETAKPKDKSDTPKSDSAKKTVIKEEYLPLEFDSPLMELFCLELKVQLHILNKSLMVLQENKKKVDELALIMRASHSMKGAARVVKLETIANLAYAMEKCAVSQQKRSLPVEDNFFTLMFQASDVLKGFYEVELGKISELIKEKTPLMQSLTKDIETL